MFAILYGIIIGIGYILGYSGNTFYILIIGFALALILIQYAIGPKTVEWSMRIRYIKENEYPKLHRMIEDLSVQAGLPKKPKIGISKVQIPNAFAFGRTIRGARVCVTEGILNLVSDEELKELILDSINILISRIKKPCKKE